MMKRPRTISFFNAAHSPKIRISAKIWKVQIKLPCGFYLKENIASGKSEKWIICQVLN
jgi:hypothetical protein